MDISIVIATDQDGDVQCLWIGPTQHAEKGLQAFAADDSALKKAGLKGLVEVTLYRGPFPAFQHRMADLRPKKKVVAPVEPEVPAEPVVEAVSAETTSAAVPPETVEAAATETAAANVFTEEKPGKGKSKGKGKQS
jgi:hypothetical protein